MHNRNDSIWSRRLADVSTTSVAAGINMQTLRNRLGKVLIQPLTQRIPAWPLIAPIWENTEIATLGVTLQKDLSLKLIFEQKNNSEQLKQSLDGLLLLGKNMIRQFQATRGNLNRPLQPNEESYLKRLENAFTETQVTQNDTRVTFSSVFKQELLSQMVDLTIPAILQARADRTGTTQLLRTPSSLSSCDRDGPRWQDASQLAGGTAALSRSAGTL
jgi:hypothetical protein